MYASGSGSGDSTDDTEPDLPEEGSGDPYKNIPAPEPSMYPPVVAEPDLSKIPKIVYTKNITSNEIPDSSDSGSSKSQQMTLTRALMTYLFPLVVIWFGGMFAELL